LRKLKNGEGDHAIAVVFARKSNSAVKALNRDSAAISVPFDE